MFKISLFFCCVFFCALTPYLTSAMTADQKAKVQEHFIAVGGTCINDNMISEDDIKELRSRKLPSGPNVPCFLACVMKGVGLMDDTGVLQKENILEMAKSIFQDEEELKLIKDYLHSCSHVNQEPVSDGDKGCERAVLAFKCMSENAAQFGLDF